MIYRSTAQNYKHINTNNKKLSNNCLKLTSLLSVKTPKNSKRVTLLSSSPLFLGFLNFEKENIEN